MVKRFLKDNSFYHIFSFELLFSAFQIEYFNKNYFDKGTFILYEEILPGGISKPRF